ncbi:hypothetical protein U6A98_23930, partial [Salmonella enterica subsp. enterica serovar Enteritidis]|nr:hypothetical protein [Salmonella enterica subsp. enterica serovar Enteritidis]
LSKKKKRGLGVKAFRGVWVRGPSGGKVLFVWVKRSASRQNTVAFLLLLEEPDAEKTSHSNNVVVGL